jgi:hypothetical protein
MQEFDDLYNKEITKRYPQDYDLKRLSKRKDKKPDTGAGRRPFKLDLKDRCIMLLVYYRLYITHTLLLAFCLT